MSDRIEERIGRRLRGARSEGLYREPPVLDERQGRHVVLNRKKLLNFASNDYLGLGCSTRAARAVAQAFGRYGPSGSSSRMVSGSYGIIREAEQAYAEHFGYEDALFFPSGYQANLAVISTLFESGDTLVFDKHVHASCVAGMTMSRARLKGYVHSSMAHLEKRLKKADLPAAAVITESLFSMDGDLLDIGRFSRLKERYGFLTIVDEAHAFGALGEKGRGIARGTADIALGTFGKALGLFGAFVLMPGQIREYLVNFASGFIYTTALPRAHGAAALSLLDIMARSDARREQLARISLLMREELMEYGFQVSGHAHILSVAVGDETLAVSLSARLRDQGILSFPARYPTVQRGKAILRISMSALHRPGDVRAYVKALHRAKKCSAEFGE